MKTVNLGCGRTKVEDWINIDHFDPDAVHVELDQEWAIDLRRELEEAVGTDVSVWVGMDLIEHIGHQLNLLQAMWQCSKPGAVALFELPYGSSDDAWEDPTHVRPMFLGSWAYFGQPNYWRADYGYTGDWEVSSIQLMKGPSFDAWLRRGLSDMDIIRHIPNTVERQRVILRAVNPQRPARRDAQPKTLDLYVVDEFRDAYIEAVDLAVMS